MARGGHGRRGAGRKPGLAVRAGFGALVAMAGMGGGTATAADPVAHGWWNRLNEGATAAAAQPPPDVPDDGMYVAGDATGPHAIAAVAFALGADERADRLVLTVAGDGVRGLIAACRVPGGTVAPAQNGPWSEAPEYDDGACVPGSTEEDGTVAFDVADLAGASSVALAIVPTGPAVRAVFEQPRPDALTTTSAPTGAGAAPATPTSAPPAEPHSPAAPRPAAAPPVPSVAFPLPPDPPAVQPPAGGADVAAAPVARVSSDGSPDWYGTAGGILGGALLFGLLLFYSLGFGPLGARYDG